MRQKNRSVWVGREKLELGTELRNKVNDGQKMEKKSSINALPAPSSVPLTLSFLSTQSLLFIQGDLGLLPLLAKTSSDPGLYLYSSQAETTMPSPSISATDGDTESPRLRALYASIRPTLVPS